MTLWLVRAVSLAGVMEEFADLVFWCICHDDVERDLELGHATCGKGFQGSLLKK
jgi:hypothetical protein